MVRNIKSMLMKRILIGLACMVSIFAMTSCGQGNVAETTTEEVDTTTVVEVGVGETETVDTTEVAE